MESDRWRRVIQLFEAALDHDPGARAAFLDAVGVEPDLRHEVESLLGAHDATGPIGRLAAHMDELRREALSGATRDAGLEAGGGAAPAGAPRLEVGHRLGRYEIRARLGAGGMGEVYRAFDSRLEREVAIKIVARRVQHRPDALRRFEQEARAASALNHPNIITVFDIGEDGSLPYIVMELVEGESLRQMLAWPLPAEALLNLAVQMADALVAAHERQIVHRDLKPENILVTRQGIAKLADFGLAQFRLEAEGDAGSEEFTRERLTQAGALLGTAGYMSPELVAGDPVDFRSDQFSFGAILYEMAAGRRAFAGQTSVEVLGRTLRDDPPTLAEARPDLPDAFVRAVEQCLRKAPGQRYASTRDLMDDLRTARRAAAQPAREPRPRRADALPAQRTAIIGRRREVEEIERLIVAEDVRLLTLTGSGGTGKTRLALHAAERLASHFGGRAFFVPLATITDPALVAPAIAQAMGGVLAVGRSALSGVIADLRGASAPTLLILDNFEQVIEGAGAVSELLAACPDLTVIVTSREILRLYGEYDLPVPPLELPDPRRLPPLEALAECPAIALFVERAHAAHPAFHLTAENAAAVATVCAGLDGLPLALELAAAQARLLSPEAMRSRLEHRLDLLTGGARDLPGRQQTLRRTIDWSHQLLDATEQALFRRLAVFAGGFTLEAAQAVADPYANLGIPVEAGVSALVDKSLLQIREPLDGEPRFLMIETIREYAKEKLAGSGEQEKTRKAHAAYFLVLAEEGGAALASDEQPRWLRRFEVEHDNFRAALEWLTARGNAEWGLRLALGLFHSWERGEHLAELRRRLTAVLVLPGAAEFPVQRARAQFYAGVLAYTQGDYEAGIDLQTQCLRHYREFGDRWGTALTLVAIGNQCAALRDYDKARRHLEQSLQVWEELGDDRGFARSLSNLAYVARMQGRFEEARERCQRAAAIFERLGDRLSRAVAVGQEGDTAREQGKLDAAEALYAEALAAFRSLEYRWGIGSALADLGGIARQRGDHAKAGRLYREALSSFAALGHRRGVARVLELIAGLAGEQGQSERGLKLASAAAVLRDRVGAPALPTERADLERSLAAMEQSVGAEAARRAWREGAATPLDEAIRLASEGCGFEAQ